VNVSALLNNFTMGEVSPLLKARTDTAPYNYGAKRLENFLVMASGGVRKRPGTWFAGFTLGNAKGRLIDFPLSDGTYVILELTHQKLRIWNHEYGLMDTVITTPYLETELGELKYAVSKDTVWIVHRNHAPKTLAWDGQSFTWNGLLTFTGINFNVPGDCPGAVAFDAGRLCFAATKNNPNGIWLSRAPDAETGGDRYTDFTLTTEGLPLAGDAVYLQENDMYGSRIKWIAANRMLLAATDRASWADSGEVPTPASFDMSIVEYAGSGDVQGKGSKEVLVYAGRNGKSLRALVFNASSDGSGYIDINISDQANHLFVERVTDIAVTDYPFPMAWIVLADGSLLSCTLNIRANMLAFSRHPLNGAVESLASVPGDDGDVLWMAVRRGDRRYVEYLLLTDVVGQNYEESHYVDSGKRIELAEPSAVIGGLEHLAGMEVRALGDGSLLPPRTVSPGGEVRFDTAVSQCHIGLPYTAFLVPNLPETPANGTSFGKKKRIEKALLSIYESFGGRVGVDMEHLEAIPYMRYGQYRLGTRPLPYTGEVELTVSGNIDPEGKVLVVHEDPAPFTVLALVERIAVLEA
jgi:hypothetical protein